MQRNFVCFVFVGIVMPAFAAAGWQADGIPICTAPHAQTTATTAFPFPSIVADAQGGAFVNWSDRRRSPRSDVFLQRLTADGSVATGWPAGGLAVDTAASSAGLARLAADGSGGVVVAWIVGTPSGGTQQLAGVYAQRITAGGTIAAGWPANGVALSTAALDGYPSIVPDGSGGAIVVWSDGRSDPGGIDRNQDVYAQHVTASGELDPGWPADGVPLCTDPADQYIPLAVTDGAGGAIVTWADKRSTSLFHIYAQRVAADGSIPSGWPVNGLPVCTAGSWQDQPAITSDGVGGAIIAWRDIRGGNVYEADIYAQRITGSGVIASGWQVDGNPVCTAPNDQQAPSLNLDGQDGVIVTWGDFRSGATYDSADVYVQRMSLGGAVKAGWPTDGVPACTAPGHQWYMQATPDDAGGTVVTWVDSRSGMGQDIYAQRILATGSVDGSWSPNGVAVCSAPGDQYGHWAAPDGAGGIIVAWQDFRNGPYPEGSDIYAARVFADGRTPTLASLVSAELGAGLIRLSWYLEDPRAMAGLHRNKNGEGWNTLALLHPDGSRLVVYEDRDVMPKGRYGYRLSFGEGRTLGEVWVTVPTAPNFSLEGFRPNPAFSDPLVAFSLLAREPATLELLDLSGRVIHSRPVSDPAGGAHLQRLGTNRSVPPGVYLLRLTQGVHSLTRKATIIR